MNAKASKLFISHSSLDLPFVKLLVDLFEHMGVRPEQMFCSSVPGFMVPLDNNIYDYLKKQFQNNDLRVIFVLSENYYHSPAALNEMGAAWVLQNKYTSILVPSFRFDKIQGAIDPMRRSIKLDSNIEQLKADLDALMTSICSEFGLSITSASRSRWELHRDDFIQKLKSPDIYWDIIRQLREKDRPVGELVLPLQKVLELDADSYDAMYMLGQVYVKLNDYVKAKKYYKQVKEKSTNAELQKKANEKLRAIEYTF